MIRRLVDRLQFLIERWMQRGALNQMLAMASIIVSVAILAGILVAIVEAETSVADAIWWAFLRLTDPGYLGDDVGAFRRSVSTFITVAGYVLFMGSLIAIMTQWLRQRMLQLERGLTPIAMRDHILILGWTSRTPSIVRELLLSEDRVFRFLRHRQVRRLRIVVMTETLDAQLATELREQLGRIWSERKIILRSGSALRSEHLRRVSARSAAAILIPGSDYRTGGAASTDARIVKTLMSIADETSDVEEDQAPVIVAEVMHEMNARIAERAYPGEIDVIASDAFLSRLIAQNVRHPGLSFIYSELLSHAEGNEIYVRSCPELAGLPVGVAFTCFRQGILLGVSRRQNGEQRTHLNPPPDFVLERDDRLIVVAERYGAAAPVLPPVEIQALERVLPRERHSVETQRILLLGWSRKAAALIREFDHYAGEHFDVDVASSVPAAERERLLERQALHLRRVRVRHLEVDYAVAGELERLEPASYDSVVFLANDWLKSGDESDARTVLGHVLYRSIVTHAEHTPHVVVELMDPENARLFVGHRDEVIISPVVLSHMLAHVALRRELHVVYDELFGPGGAEIGFRTAAEYGLTGEEVDFFRIQQEARRTGEIALGVRPRAEGETGGVRMNPPREQRFTLDAGDQIAVLMNYTRE